MKTAVVIAEYNPFHKGHQWQLEQLRKEGVDHIAVVMSPDFTQRGTPAILPKRVRAKAALENGADLILELPVAYACASAQRFAYGAVQTACAMGCADWLAFGAENHDLLLLQQAADALDNQAVQTMLREKLNQGITFAKARELAVEKVYGGQVSRILQQPNNILAVEYLSQLGRCGYPKKPAPLVIERVGNAHDGMPAQGFASASYLRQLILAEDWQQSRQYLPPSVWEQYIQAHREGMTAKMQHGERAVLSALRRMQKEQLAQLPDLSEGIENRLYQSSRQSCSIQELYDGIKTKRYPLSRVRRLVMAAFLELPPSLHRQPPAYLRVLGMNARGREILSQMKQTAQLPVSTSLTKLEQIDEQAKQFAQLESRCADQYWLFTETVCPCGEDRRRSAVFL